MKQVERERRRPSGEDLPEGVFSMVFLEDFTRATAGREIPIEGRVRCCPRCGRSGVEQQAADGLPLVIHTQISEVLGDGMLIEPRDCCAITRKVAGHG
jgi:hypothetical protein